MMKTALSIIQSVCYRMDLPAPTALVSLTDPQELQLLHILYAVCEELRALRCWPQLKRTYSFDTVSSQQSYQLPPDFYSLLSNSYWNGDEDSRMIGPVDDNAFQYLLQSGSSSTENYTFRLFGRDENTASAAGQIWLNPTPSGTDAIKLEYLSRSFILPKNWAASTAFSAGTYCNASGNIYSTTAGGTTGSTVPSHTSSSASDGGVTWVYYSSPYETVVADTDIVVFDDDLVKLGIRAKWMEEKGGDYADAQAQYLSAIDQAMARYKGSFSFSAPGRRWGPRYSVQYKTWTF